MVGFDVGHDRHRRRQRQERPVEFVRFDDGQVGASDPRIPAPPCDTAADESRGIPSGGRERLRHHHRGSGLAVRAGDRHHRPPGHRLTQSIGPPHDRDPQLPGPFELRVVLADRRRYHDRPHPVEVPGIVTLPNFDPQGRQIGGSRRICIATRYPHTPSLGHRCQSTHPRTTYSHEVHWTGICGSKQGH